MFFFVFFLRRAKIITALSGLASSLNGTNLKIFNVGTMLKSARRLVKCPLTP